MRKSLPVMNAPSGPRRSAPTVPTSSGVPPRPAGESSIMRRYPSPRGPVSSSVASGVKMMPGLIVLIRAAPLAPPNGLGHHAQGVPALGELVGVERVCDLIRLEDWEVQQLVGRSGRQCRVLLGG